MTPAQLDQWFADEILPHEAALTRFLRRVWKNQAEVPDFRQEIYVRVYQGASHRLPLWPKSFLFATARNLIADRIRRERIVSIDYTQDLDSLNVLVDELSPEERTSARQDFRRLADAFDQLPDRYREVIWLRRVEGLSQKETAQRLGVAEGTIESHLCRGLQALMRTVFGHGANEPRRAADHSDDEIEHG